jgi:hypothetical protein
MSFEIILCVSVLKSSVCVRPFKVGHDFRTADTRRINLVVSSGRTSCYEHQRAGCVEHRKHMICSPSTVQGKRVVGLNC